jgi:small multidrug resistance pump
MAPALFLWLIGSALVFLAANSTLRAYAGNGQVWVVVGAMCLYIIGNLMMVRLMRESGLGVAIAVSSVVQLVMAVGVGMAVFGERPSTLQLGGMALGLVAVTMIAWPAGEKL